MESKVKKEHRKTIRIHGEKMEKTFSKKADADRWYLEKKREKDLVESGLSFKVHEVTVEEFSSKWLQQRKQNGKPLSSWESDEGRLRLYILPHFGSREMNRIGTKEWESFFDSLVADELISPATRNRVRSLASKMYNDALRKECVVVNPISTIPRLKESMECWDYWASSEEIERYLDFAKRESSWFHIFALVSLNLGTRAGETLALNVEDFNLKHDRVQICKIFEETSGTVQSRTKAHKPRWLGINESLKDALIRHLNEAEFNKPGHALICNEDGKRLYERQVRRVHERVCTLANVKTIRIHDLRHTYASHYIMNGGSLADLQNLLGHSSPTMTFKYTHLAPGYLEKKAGVVSFGKTEQNVVQMRKIR